MDDHKQQYRIPQNSMIAGARFAGIVLSCLSAIASLVVVVSYIRMLYQFRAHQRKIIKATIAPGGTASAAGNGYCTSAAAAAGMAGTCFSCESSLATPCVSKSFFPSNRQASISTRFANGAIAGSGSGAAAAGRPISSAHVPAPSINTVAAAAAIASRATNAARAGSLGANKLSTTAPHRSSMPPLAHAPLSVGKPHYSKEGSRATSLDMAQRASSQAKHQQRVSNGLVVPNIAPLSPAAATGAVAATASAASLAVVSVMSIGSAEGESTPGYSCSDNIIVNDSFPTAAAHETIVGNSNNNDSDIIGETSNANGDSGNSKLQQTDSSFRRTIWQLLFRRRRHENGQPQKTSIERGSLDMFKHNHKRRKLPRIPSSKIAVLSAIDMLMHALWVVNTTATGTDPGCTASMFFYHWIQLFYMFFLASFVSRSALRLRNLQSLQPQNQRRTDLLYCSFALGASLILSLLPATMSKSQYDDELMVCWFVRGDPITVRWLWMTLNTWVVLSLLFLIANSIYVGVILSNERKDLLSFIAHSAAPITVTGESGAKSDNAGIQSVYPQSAIPGLRLSHQVVPPIFALQPNIGPLQTSALHSGTQIHRSTLIGDSRTYGNMVATFGVKSTPLTSRESLATHPTNSASARCGDSVSRDTGALSTYPPTHPVAIAHEALHGRRHVAPSITQNSIPVYYCCSCGSGRSSGAYEACKHSSYALSSSGSGRNSELRQSLAQNHMVCKMHQWIGESGSSHKSSSRGNSIIVPCGPELSIGGGSRSRPVSTLPEKNHARLSRRMYMASDAIVANDSESSRICAWQPWDSSRRLLHKHSSTSSLAAPSDLAVTSTDRRPLYGFYAQRPVVNRNTAGVSHTESKVHGAPKHMSMPVEPKNVGFISMDCSKDMIASHNNEGAWNKPNVPTAAAIASASQRHNVRQSVSSHNLRGQRSPQPQQSSHHNHGYSQQHRRSQQQKQHSWSVPKRHHYSMDPRVLAAAVSGRTTHMPSIHEDCARIDEDIHISGISPVDYRHLASISTAQRFDIPSFTTDSAAARIERSIRTTVSATATPSAPSASHALSDQPFPTAAAAAATLAATATMAAAKTTATTATAGGVQSAALPHGKKISESSNDPYRVFDIVLNFARRWFGISRNKKAHRKSKAQGQMRRIERRVHTLVATGALRVATRAMVPLLTQLCMVIWSTVYSLSPKDNLGNKGNVLYVVAILLLSLQGLLDMALYFIFDTHSDVSEVSLPSCAHPMSVFSRDHNLYTSNSDKNSKSPDAQYTQARYPSLLNLHSDVYYSSYTPRDSYDAYNRYYSHMGNQNQYTQNQRSATNNFYSHGFPSNYWANRQAVNYHRRSNSFTSAVSNGSKSTGPAHSKSTRAARAAIVAANMAADRKFTFNFENLNIRRVDRTSNAMQSDTLHGSDCMAWSHTDGISVHDATSSISLFSGSVPAHNQYHRPVLNNWEEIELEEVSSPTGHREHTGNWSDSGVSRNGDV